MIADFFRSARFAARNLWRAPGFTSVAILSLGLGIAGCSLIFSAFDAVMLRSVPVREPGRLARVFTTARRATQDFNPTSYPDYVDIRDSDIFDGVAAFRAVELGIDEAGVTDTLSGQLVSGNYFEVIGVRAATGRTFTAGEDRADSPVRVVVLSDAFWRSRYGADPAVIGRTVTVAGAGYTVIGVAPRGFGGIELGDDYDAWFPMALQSELLPPPVSLARQLGTTSILGLRAPRWLNIVGRLRDGATAADASAALEVVAERLATEYPDSNTNIGFLTLPLGEGPGIRGRNRSSLGLMFAAAISVLLAACLNVASLMLARAITRRRDMAVRAAIGAGPTNLAVHCLAEAVLLGVLGAAGGVLLAYFGVPLLAGLSIPDGIDLGINSRVLSFAVATGVITGLMFGLAPVGYLRGRNVAAELNNTGGLTPGVRSMRFRDTFVVLQIALSLILLVGGGLLARTVQKAYAVDLGYSVESILLADVNLEIGRYSADEGRAFYDELLDRLNRLPGVQTAAAANVPVLTGFSRMRTVSQDGQPIRPDGSNMLTFASNTVSDRYLATMGIPLIEGRSFESTDRQDSPRVTIVTESLADRLWPGVETVGQTLAIDPPAEVVGVVPDTVYASALDPAPPPLFYLPLRQNAESRMTLHLRTTIDPYAVLSAVRQTLRDQDPRIALSQPRLLSDELTRSLSVQRSVAGLVGVFSVIAAILAAIGLYGTMAYTVRQTVSEIGLRMALGATSFSIMSKVVGKGGRLLVAGAALGVGGTLFGARFIESRLFGVEATDAVTWLAVMAGLLIIGLLGCAVPAGQAMRTDPSRILRSV